MSVAEGATVRVVQVSAEDTAPARSVEDTATMFGSSPTLIPLVYNETPLSLHKFLAASGAVGGNSVIFTPPRRAGFAEPQIWNWMSAWKEPTTSSPKGLAMKLAGTLPVRLAAERDRHEAAWRGGAMKRIMRVLCLPFDWDSQGSDAPPPATAAEALSFLGRVLAPNAVPPAVVPLSGGGIQLEWHRHGADVEIILGPVEDRGIYVVDDAGEWEGSPDDDEDVGLLAQRLREIAAATVG